MATITLHNPQNFGQLFIEEYLSGGLGRMQKRDIDILMLYLLLKDGQYQFPQDIFKAARDLKLTETKVRNLYQEVQLRYQQLKEDDAKKALVAIIEKKAFELRGERLVFIVRDPMLGQFFQEWVASVDGFTDSSFNPNLVSIDKSVFRDVLDKIAVKDFGKFPAELDALNQENNRNTLLDMFMEELVKASGSKTGEVAITALASGLKVLLLGG